MDAERASKRRRLDPAENEKVGSASNHRGKTTPSTTTKRVTPGSQKRTGVTPADSRAASAQAAWREAKSQSVSYKSKRRPGVEQVRGTALVDGAAVSPVDSKITSTPKSTGTLKSAKKQLDHLRNHWLLSSSPRKLETPSRGKAALGFFKQFQGPKKDDGAQDSVRELASEGMNGQQGNGHISPDHEDDVMEDELPADTSDRTMGTTARQSKRTNALLNGGKKTFEDEIKELESRARKEAEEEEDQDTPASSVTRGKRLSTRFPVRLEATQGVSVPTKPLGRRKLAKNDRQQLQTSDEANFEDGSDEQEQEEVTGLSTNGQNPKSPAITPRPILPSLKAGGRLSQQPASAAPATTFQADELQILQTALIEKTTGHRMIPITHLDEEHAKVSTLITQTITAGESNSLLLIGARGSGKTALVNTILREQAVQHPDDFHVVRLNGFIHTDDKIALREIWRQLGRDMGFLGENESTARNYADTMATLLALLSHHAETGQEQGEGQISKSVIFVLDEFDLFAHHPRQTLLYNLFDIAQSRKAPIAVLGLTTRIDVTEQLEKRVKSRFSHRYVYLSLPKSFAVFQDIIRAALSLVGDDLQARGTPETTIEKEKAATSIEQGTMQKLVSGIEGWNGLVDHLLSVDPLDSHLKRIYHTTKSIPDAIAMLLIPLMTMPTEAETSARDIIEHFATSLAANRVAPPDSKLAILASLSTLQLALLICAARLSAIHNADTVSFLLAYEEYKTLASKAKLQATASGMAGPGAGARVWRKEVARGAWASLLEQGLVMEDGRSGSGTGRVDVGLEEIGTMGASGIDLGVWGRWCREI